MKNFFIQYPALASFFTLGIFSLIALAIRKSNEPDVPAIEEPANNTTSNSNSRITDNTNTNQRYGSQMVYPNRTTLSTVIAHAGAMPGAAGGRFSSVKS